MIEQQSTEETAVKLQPGMLVTGLKGSEEVRIEALTEQQPGVYRVVFVDMHGQPSITMKTTAELDELQVACDQARLEYDGDATEFRLAAEALRIKNAGITDPLAAVNSSNVEPLPHQLRAVYGELLPRVPLRFLLADDPGAGKTIMAGLYIKELMLRSACARCLIVAPGGLAPQWQEELDEKFGLDFEIFDRAMHAQSKRNVFEDKSYLIARMDQLSRDEELWELLSDVEWDVVVVDEAHRMSASYSTWAGEPRETKRYQLGKVLSGTARHLLLMSATPHSGKDEDFQLFMQLLDQDLFEVQKSTEGSSKNNTGLMRRMVKEDLLTFEGKPLFPERIVTTVEYNLSPLEADLYDSVTEYVRTEMGRADKLDGRRGNNVGFALTMLQRRLASSPQAIMDSLIRRRDKLNAQLQECVGEGRAPQDLSLPLNQRGASRTDADGDFTAHWGGALDDDLSDEEFAVMERQADAITDLATAARTVEELKLEIGSLEELVRAATLVHSRGEDRKWAEVSELLQANVLQTSASGIPRKLIIFTEHRDTLNYLEKRVQTLMGKENAVLTIHGGTSRDERHKVREEFNHNPDVRVLLATDAAGEGMNLQRAHLMINYDLPWNPNRIEQRFGRIHRIGQKEVCHLWNLVAKDTREGEVFQRLLTKIETQDKAYNGKLFNVLGQGEAFQNESLRDLLIRAVRYGDDPEVRRRLDETIDASVAEGLHELLTERALHPEMFATLNVAEEKRRIEEAKARRLQPGFIEAFFVEAFAKAGGQLRQREHGRSQIPHVPAVLREIAVRMNRRTPLASSYERVTFDPAHQVLVGAPDAVLIAPGHPLLDALIEWTLGECGDALRRGTVLVDRSPEQADCVTAVVIVEQDVVLPAAGNAEVSRFFEVVHLAPGEEPSAAIVPPYRDFDEVREEERTHVPPLLDGTWASDDHGAAATAWLYGAHVADRVSALKEQRTAEAQRVRELVRSRLGSETSAWYQKYNELVEKERTAPPGRLSAAKALEKAESLERRAAVRLQELEHYASVNAKPPVARGVALVVPSMLLGDSQVTPELARETQRVERRAVDAVLAAERRLGRTPHEMPHNNKGYDIHSFDAKGHGRFIEVKGRVEGGEGFYITANEVDFAHTHRDIHYLALVRVSDVGPDHDEVRYVHDAFAHLSTLTSTKKLEEAWEFYWSRGHSPR